MSKAACALHPSDLGIMIPLRNSMCQLGILYDIRKIVQTQLLMCLAWHGIKCEEQSQVFLLPERVLVSTSHS